jgi:hypothetical protein
MTQKEFNSLVDKCLAGDVYPECIIDIQTKVATDRVHAGINSIPGFTSNLTRSAVLLSGPQVINQKQNTVNDLRMTSFDDSS